MGSLSTVLACIYIEKISVSVGIKESAIHRAKTHPHATLRIPKSRDPEGTPSGTITELTWNKEHKAELA